MFLFHPGFTVVSIVLPSQTNHVLYTEASRQMTNLNSRVYTILPERLPILLCFGSVLVMSVLFCIFHKTKRSVNIEESTTKHKDESKKSGLNVFSGMSTCFNRDKFQINKVRKYFVSKTSKTKKTNDTNGSNHNQGKIGPTIKKDVGPSNRLVPKQCDDRLSKINHLSIGDEEFLDKGSTRAYSEAGEEASLTQIVIAQIEHDNNERNRKVVESPHNRGPASRGTNGKSSLDKNQREQRMPKSMDAKSKNEEQAIKCKLNVPLNLTNNDKISEDPIYDVPPSKSLINLSSSADEEISLQKQHHIHVNSDLAYFHTSSPNIFLNVDQEESIYDTPSTRSLAV